MSHMIYGVVFGNRISDPRTYELFEKFLERKDMTIDLAIAENTKPLQVSSFSKFYWYIQNTVTSFMKIAGSSKCKGCRC